MSKAHVLIITPTKEYIKSVSLIPRIGEYIFPDIIDAPILTVNNVIWYPKLYDCYSYPIAMKFVGKCVTDNRIEAFVYVS